MNAKLEKVEIKNDSLLIEAFGIVSHIPFKYRYAIKLYKLIDPKSSYEKVESVGTMYVNLTKVEPGIFYKLIKFYGYVLQKKIIKHQFGGILKIISERIWKNLHKC